MWMVAGLGNPGREYERTRHNIGFRVVDGLAERWSVRLNEKKFNALMGRAQVFDKDIRLMLPQTYMNLSGESVGPAAGFFKIKPERLIAVHDELKLAFGKVERKQGGGHGGHNGLRSLHKHLPNEGYQRVRVGIGRPPQGWDPAKYVLAKFSSDEEASMDAVVEQAMDAVEACLQG